MSKAPNSLDWGGLIDLAEELLQAKTSKVDSQLIFRSAINRAYYGAHKSASSKLEALNILSHGRSVHEQVIKYYLDSNDPIGIKIGTKLRMLKRYRNHADYVSSPPPRRGGAYTVGLCESLIKDARYIYKDLRRVRIANATN